VNGDRCVVTIEAGGSYIGRPLMFQVGASSDGCAVADDPDVPPGSAPPGGGVMGSSSGSGGDTPGVPGHGCGCRVGASANAPLSGAILFLASLAMLRRRRAARVVR